MGASRVVDAALTACCTQLLSVPSGRCGIRVLRSNPIGGVTIGKGICRISCGLNNSSVRSVVVSRRSRKIRVSSSGSACAVVGGKRLCRVRLGNRVRGVRGSHGTTRSIKHRMIRTPVPKIVLGACMGGKSMMRQKSPLYMLMTVGVRGRVHSLASNAIGRVFMRSATGMNLGSHVVIVRWWYTGVLVYRYLSMMRHDVLTG